jgi:hypothetical protein
LILMIKTTTSFKSALSFQTRRIDYFYSRIEQQKLILQQIQAILPDDLKYHARHCIISNKKLLIYTDSATWASQLRFYSKAILAAIAPVTNGTVEIMQLKLLTEQTTAKVKTDRKANFPSLEKIYHIRNQGLMISDDQLKRALLNLSATLERLSGQLRT